ncbi:MAG: metallophosphoesterase [Candidatus Eremiobacteraeota bacterium]|nr:metallophosphoesterase [Candidatus Eremiobacteraeota bacterium]
MMRRGDFLAHVGWTGAGITFALDGLGLFSPVAADAATGFSFVQISDSHIGFKQPANPDVTGTLKNAIERINALPVQPAFVVHTGDITHLATAAQFDDAKQLLSTLRAPVLTIPGEHDAIGSEGMARYKAAFGRAGEPNPWYSWDQGGTHFVALVNVFNFETMGLLGQEQLDWLDKDLARYKNDTPLVVFGHVPLYALYPKWGWTTEDGGKALAMLRRFSSVTVLNGHIHQIVTHREGNLRFYTAAATAYPQPAPGTAEKPGPLAVPPDRLLHVIGYRTVAVEAAVDTVADHELA